MSQPVEPADRSDYPARIAGFLEDLATKIRSLTVDRVAVAVTWMAIGLIIFAAVVMILIWLLVGLFRALGELLGSVEAAYALVGGILIIVGALLWWRRYPKEDGARQE